MKQTTFKDNFSEQSDLYVKYRPHYPPELYTYLASLTARHACAWDCGTGNGQAATGLAAYYEHVIATDPSEQQIKNALPNEKVRYRVEKAEHSSIPAHSVDLLTVANALHWFDFDTFYAEAKRVLKNDGVIAAWAYGPPTIAPEVDAFVQDFHDHTLRAYWLAENRLVEKEYTTIPFPFEPIVSPAYSYAKAMNLHDLIGFLNTWSATRRFIRENGLNPTRQLLEDLKTVWKDVEETKIVRWKLVLKIGRFKD